MSGESNEKLSPLDHIVGELVSVIKDLKDFSKENMPEVAKEIIHKEEMSAQYWGAVAGFKIIIGAVVTILLVLAMSTPIALFTTPERVTTYSQDGFCRDLGYVKPNVPIIKAEIPTEQKVIMGILALGALIFTLCSASDLFHAIDRVRDIRYGPKQFVLETLNNYVRRG